MLFESYLNFLVKFQKIAIFGQNSKKRFMQNKHKRIALPIES